MAKQFRFPLEKVLNYKKKIEDIKAEELNHSREKKKYEEEKLENIEKKKQNILIGDDSRKKMTLNQLNISTDYMLQLNDQIEKGYNIFYDSQVEVKHHYTESGASWKGIG